MVKLFTPDGTATWLLTELDADDQDSAYAEVAAVAGRIVT